MLPKFVTSETKGANLGMQRESNKEEPNRRALMRGVSTPQATSMFRSSDRGSDSSLTSRRNRLAWMCATAFGAAFTT